MTQDTNRKVTTSQLDITKESQEVSPFQAGDNKAHIWFFLTGQVFTMAVYILSIPDLGTEQISKVLEWIFLLTMPNFDLGSALMDMYSNSMFKDTCEKVIPFCEFLPANLTFGCCPG